MMHSTSPTCIPRHTHLHARTRAPTRPHTHVCPRHRSQVDHLLIEAKARAARGERTLATVLTRVGAERLCDFLNEHGLPTAYMHSGTKPLDRVRVLRQLRQGEVHVLVGVNLLREGLDLPEVCACAARAWWRTHRNVIHRAPTTAPIT